MSQPEDRALLIEALHAIDRLSSWVRSSSYREHGYSGPRKFIYAAKRSAILQARDAGLQEGLRAIEVQVRCRDCGGSGRYYTWHGDTLDHCWACSSTGTAKLQFIETQFPSLGLRWHTPRDKFPWICGVAMPVVPEPAGDWSPNQPGKDLDPSQAAELLLVVEAWYRVHIPQRRSIEQDENLAYKLYVGSEPEDRCSLCGAFRPPREDHPKWRTGSNLGVSRNGIRWTAHACQECDAKPWATSSQWDGERYVPDGPCRFAACPWPAALVTPAIQRWIEAHREETGGME